MLRTTKIRGSSEVLARDFHADLHVGDAPVFLMLCIGGSGKSREEYQRRGDTRIEIFDEACERAQPERPTGGLLRRAARLAAEPR